jgi:predicted acetyltransferase
MPELVKPHFKYKDSFIEAVREYQAEGLPNYLGMSADKLDDDFDNFLDDISDATTGTNLPVGYVPHSVWWLVEGNEYLGRVDIRHQLNEYLRNEGGQIGYDIRPTQRGMGYGKLILKLGLKKAKELGFTKILITCDITNLPSKKVIEANGGILEDVRPTRPGQPDKARFWIEVKN